MLMMTDEINLLKRVIKPLCFAVGFMSVLAMPIQANDAEELVQQMVPFQGRLHGSDNKPVENGRYNLQFSLYDAAVGGQLQWSEKHEGVSVIQGYTNVLLGVQSKFENPQGENLDFSKPIYVGISINDGAELFPRQQLIPSFHAVTATDAKTLDGNGPEYFATQQRVSDLSTDYSIFKHRLNYVGLTPELDSEGQPIAIIDPDTNHPIEVIDPSTGNSTQVFEMGVEYAQNSKNADTLDGKNSTDFADVRLESYFDETFDAEGDLVSSEVIVKNRYAPFVLNLSGSLSWPKIMSDIRDVGALSRRAFYLPNTNFLDGPYTITLWFNQSYSHHVFLPVTFLSTAGFTFISTEMRIEDDDQNLDIYPVKIGAGCSAGLSASSSVALYGDINVGDPYVFCSAYVFHPSSSEYALDKPIQVERLVITPLVQY